MLHRARVFLPELIALAGCSVMPPDSFPREDRVDIDRFTGAWYVIAHIPPSATKNAYYLIERDDL